MPAIRINAQLLELAGSNQLALERNSPLLSGPDEAGSSSQAFRLLKTPRNNRELGYPNRFDQRAGQVKQVLDVEAIDDAGAGVTSGNLVFRGVEPDAYLYNLEFGDSAAMAKLKARRMQTFQFGGPRAMEPPAGRDPSRESDGTLAMLQFMQHVAEHPEGYDFTFAPFSNNDHAGQWDSYLDLLKTLGIDTEPVHTHNFNTWGGILGVGANGQGFVYPFEITIPGAAVVLPKADNCNPCPLPKLEYLVRTVFKELQLELLTDVFDDPEMQQLVVVPTGGSLDYLVNPDPSSTPTASFTLSKHVPDVTAQVFIRRLMDTFGWHFDTDPTGRCRLLRAAPLVLNGDAVDISALTGPAFNVEMQEATSIVVNPLLPENDRYTEQFSEQPEPAAILMPVATAAELPAATAADVYRLVQSERRYYVGVATTTEGATGEKLTTYSWTPGPFYLPGQQVGEAENTSEYSVGSVAVLTYQVPIFTGLGNIFVESLCFMEPSYTTTQSTITASQSATAGPYVVTSNTNRSQNLRLAFYRGLQPLSDGTLLPWLTQRNIGPDGQTLIGERTLEVHGRYGLVQQCLLPLLALKAAATLVKYPAFVTARQFNQLDFSRLVSVQGDEFMLRRVSLTIPVTRPGQFELVPRGQVATVTSRATVSAGFYVDDAEAGPACTLLITSVEKNNDVATVLTSAAQGQVRYQLDKGDLQDSNVFSGLTSGRKYVFWVYDMGVVGCHQKEEVVW